MRRMIDRGEEIARDEIRAIPDGVYTGSDTMEAGAEGTGDVRIDCTVKIEGDRMRVSISGPPQTQNTLNSYKSNTISAVYWAYLSALKPGIPVNEGIYRPAKSTWVRRARWSIRARLRPLTPPPAPRTYWSSRPCVGR